MNISKPVKIFVGFLTVFAILFPFVIMPVFMMFFVFSSGFPFFNPHSVPNPGDFEAMLPFMMVFYPLMMCYSLVQLGLQIFYVIHDIKNKALTDTFRILFAIGTFLLPYVAMPIYFVVYMWKDAPQESQLAQA
jgi:amino acid transporter